MNSTDHPGLTCSFVLPPALDLRNAADLRLRLLETIGDCSGIQDGQVLTVDGAGVERVATPGVQVLLAAAKTMAAHGGTLVLDPVSPPLVEGLRLLGMSSLLDTKQEAVDG